jgi:PAS domain S-box-containing protein
VENELTHVVDAVPGIVWTALSDGRIDFLNQYWYEYTGTSDDSTYGQSWQTAIHPEDLPSLLDRWRSIQASAGAGEMEARIRRFDGEYRWFRFRTRPSLNSSGQTVKWFGLSTEIGGQSRSTEQASPADDRQIHAIVDSIPAMMALMTPGGEVEYVNSSTLEYLGTTLEELRGWTTSDVIHPDDRPAVVATWMRSVETGEPYDIEHRVLGADGSYRWFRLRGRPVKDSDGRITRWCVLRTDVDDRRRAEAMLAGEKQFLELVAGDHAMSEILDALCQLVESITSGCYCSVVLADPSGARFEQAAAPSLPSSFITSVVGRPVNPDAGPSAMAAYLNEQVVAADLTSEKRWDASEWVRIAQLHGIQACWSSPITSAAGKVLGAFALYYKEPKTPTPLHRILIKQFSDIASIAIERTRAAEAMRESDARKAAILDAALDCIVTIDHESRITEFNPAAERTFGYQREQVIGKQLADVIIPLSLREAHRRGFAHYLATGEARLLGRRVEMAAVGADGREFPIELAITRIGLDGPPSFTGYMRDITERRQSEEDLRRSEAFLVQAQRLSSTGSFLWRISTDEITFSEESMRIFQFDQGERVTLERIGSRVHPDDIPMLSETIALARSDRRDFDYEIRLQMPDHSIKYLHTIAQGSRDRDGQLEYFGAIQDVTERRLSDEALSTARSELARVASVMSLGTLTASIAHEVNQPLSGIMTNASTCLRMLGTNPPNVEGARETARRAIRDADRASEVIKRLRALFSKHDAIAESVDLNEATREVIALSLSELQRNRVIVRTELADDLPRVTGDRVQLQQVILNLLTNAADAMSEVYDRPRRVVITTERDEGDRVRLTVQDAGRGFESENRRRLFDAFYTTKDSGMGIGLSVSQSIIERHHGRLWAEPNDGPGASFFFSIPQSFEVEGEAGIASGRKAMAP